MVIEIIYFLFVLLASFSVGKRVLKPFKLDMGFFEELVFGVSMGYVVFLYFTFFLGILGLLYSWLFKVVFVLLVVVSLFDLRYLKKKVKNPFSNAGFLAKFLIACLLVFFLLNFIVSLSPPHGSDVLSYQLAVPKIYIRAHSILYLPSIFMANQPPGIQMIYLFGLILNGAILANLIAYSIPVMLSLAIITFSKRFFKLEVGLLGALIFYSMPHLMLSATKPYSDTPLALFCFLAFYAFIIWFKKMDIKWLIISGIMMGVAFSIKYFSIIAFASIFLFLLVRLFALPKERKSFWSKIYTLIVFCFMAFLMFSPFLVKSYVYTGNPIYPLLPTIFDGRYYDVQHFELFKQSLATHGFGINVKSYILLPWNVTMHGQMFADFMGIGAVFLAFIPLLFFTYRKNYVLNLLLGISILIITAWFLMGAQEVRYVRFLLPLLSVLASFVVVQLFSFRSKLVNLVVVGLLLSNLAFNMALWAGVNKQEIPVIFGLESEEQFYDGLKDWQLYDASKFINGNTPENSKILLYRDNRGYFIDREYVHADFHLGYVDFLKFKNEDDFLFRLRELGITHILVNTNALGGPEDEHTIIFGRFDNIFRSFVDKYAERIYSRKGIEVYGLK